MAFIRLHAHHSMIRRLHLPHGIRKFHLSRGLKFGLLGAATLPFGGARLAGGLLRGAAGLGRLGIRGLSAGRSLAARAIGRGRSTIAGVSSQLQQIADEFGIPAEQLAAAAVQQGVIDDSDLEDEGDATWMGDPATPHRRQRARAPRGGRHTSSGGGRAGALADLAAQIAQSGALPGVPPGVGLPQLPASITGGHTIECARRSSRTGRCTCRRVNARTGKCIRRMNPTNVHALRHSMRRVIAFEKVAQRATHQLRKMVSKSHVVPRSSSHSHRGKKGCSCK